MPFSRLVEPPAPSVRVIRAGDGPRLRSDQADFASTLLTAGGQGRRDLYVMEFEPGAPRHAALDARLRG